MTYILLFTLIGYPGVLHLPVKDQAACELKAEELKAKVKIDAYQCVPVNTGYQPLTGGGR